MRLVFTLLLQRFDGTSALFASPQTLTCDETSMQWTYDNAGSSQPFTTIECVCLPEMCNIPFIGIDFTAVTPPDNNCIYYNTIECQDMSKTQIEYNFGADLLPNPGEFQCTGNEPDAYYRNGANVLTMITWIQCP
uniref:Uncharacterized protein n=1 Tax=Panagrolaimus sp. ES5 TaxID=591445 RepID=A0AC34GUU1_9BILA